MIVGADKPPVDELAHYGVKGMKWGVRKAHQPTNAKYTGRMQVNDRRQHGKRAVQRINRRMNEGESREKALEREDIRNARQRLAVMGAAYAAVYLSQHGGVAVATRAATNRKAAETIGIGSTAAKIKYIKPNRHGVHKITTLK